MDKELPQDVIKIIKLYSKPYYRKPLHFIALSNVYSFCFLKYDLKQTPYSRGEEYLAGNSCYNDVKRAMSGKNCLYYLSFSFLMIHNLDLAHYLINFNEDENTPIINIHEEIDYQHTIISI